MTMSMQHENTEVKSHQTHVNRDELLHSMAEYAISTGSTVDRTFADYIKLAMEQPDFKSYISGSIFRSFNANSLDFAMTKIIKVNYGKNPNMLIGNVVHKAREEAIEYKVKHNTFPPLSKIVRVMKEYLHDQYKYLNPDLVKDGLKLDIFIKSCKLFKSYYTNILPHNRSIASEVKMTVNLPVGSFNNPNNAKYFVMSGIVDSVEKDDKGNIILTDLKTSKKIVGKKIVMSDTLTKLVEEKKDIETKIANCNKVLKKFKNAEEKFAEAENTLKDVLQKLKDAKANEKPTKALENRETKWTDEVDKWKENFETYSNAKNELSALNLRLTEVKRLSKPLMESYKKEQYESDLQECKKKHEWQLLCYAIEYMIEYGVQPKKLRVENIVKTLDYSSVYTQVFEWEITREDLVAVQEKILNVIHTIELVLDGVDPILIFKSNPDSMIGSDTESFKDELIETIKTMKENNTN